VSPEAEVEVELELELLPLVVATALLPPPPGAPPVPPTLEVSCVPLVELAVPPWSPALVSEGAPAAPAPEPPLPELLLVLVAPEPPLRTDVTAQLKANSSGSDKPSRVRPT